MFLTKTHSSGTFPGALNFAGLPNFVKLDEILHETHINSMCFCIAPPKYVRFST
jgi:hypothetical protein